MKKWLIFICGVLTGIALTFVVAFMFTVNRSESSESNNGMTWFDKPGDVIEAKTFKVFQVLSENAALVNEQSDIDLEMDMKTFTGALYLLTNEDGKYYYDDEIIKVPEGKVARIVGIFQYQTNSDFGKTVPIIRIMNK